MGQQISQKMVKFSKLQEIGHFTISKMASSHFLFSHSLLNTANNSFTKHRRIFRSVD